MPSKAVLLLSLPASVAQLVLVVLLTLRLVRQLLAQLAQAVPRRLPVVHLVARMAQAVLLLSRLDSVRARVPVVPHRLLRVLVVLVQVTAAAWLSLAACLVLERLELVAVSLSPQVQALTPQTVLVDWLP